jgi:hypothetical protein
MNSQDFVNSRGIKYLGQYKPNIPYELGDGFLLLPAGSVMFPYGPNSEVRLNVSYFVSTASRNDAELSTAFRDWLIFDAFILSDHFPIFYYDENLIGSVESVPDEVAKSSQTPDYKQIDYSNIAYVSLGFGPTQDGLPSLSYMDAYRNYRALPFDKKDLIEWFVSGPRRSQARPMPFFNTSYWQLLHFTILLERLIGSPPPCTQSFSCETCQRSLPPHDSKSRKKWRRQFLSKRIHSDIVVEEYARLIETGIEVRNKFVHATLFDRSSMPELTPGETQTYGTGRAVEDYEHDSVALSSLRNSLNNVCRYLLLDVAFNTGFFMNLRPLNVIRISES